MTFEDLKKMGEDQAREIAMLREKVKFLDRVSIEGQGKIVTHGGRFDIDASASIQEIMNRHVALKAIVDAMQDLSTSATPEFSGATFSKNSTPEILINSIDDSVSLILLSGISGGLVRSFIKSTGMLSFAAYNSTKMTFRSYDDGVTVCVGIGTIFPNANALLDLTSTTGALLLTRLTTTQRDALTPVDGMLIYNSTTNSFQGYQAGSWQNLI